LQNPTGCYLNTEDIQKIKNIFLPLTGDESQKTTNKGLAFAVNKKNTKLRLKLL